MARLIQINRNIKLVCDQVVIGDGYVEAIVNGRTHVRASFDGEHICVSHAKPNHHYVIGGEYGTEVVHQHDSKNEFVEVEEEEV